MKVVIRKFGEAEVNHEIGVFASLVESPLARSTIQRIPSLTEARACVS